MNHQRKLIFHQRVEWMKDEAVNEIVANMRHAARRLGEAASKTGQRVAGGQDYEVRYEAKKPGKSKAKVKRAVKKAGPSRKKVERSLGD